MKQPPRKLNYEGQPRRLGVEIEFAALSVAESANKVRSLFGGTPEEIDPHRFYIRNTSLGDFVCELDTRVAHRGAGRAPLGRGGAWDDFRRRLHAVLGDISSLVMPCEIVCPPVTLGKLEQLDHLVSVLAETGAEGTRANPFFAFGAQLNPELADRSTEWILSVLKAYLLTSDWLRAIMSIDFTRRLVAYADPFPKEYAAMVVAPDYWPSQDRMIDDYITANPTRNRELDMLPLFAWLDEARVRNVVTDPRVKARPTFHYRLPDANLDDANWSITAEWDRWVIVERLAEQRRTLDTMGAAYRANRQRFIPEDWALRSSEWLVML
ncbi:MAG: amidoligase family protein [Rhodomicrobiaceae bacterium]